MPEPTPPPTPPDEDELPSRPPTENIFGALWECACDFSIAPLGNLIVREWSVVKRSPTILFVTLLVAIVFGYWIKSQIDTSSVNDAIAIKDSAKDIKAERDATNIQLAVKDAALKQAENTLAAWKQKASNPFRAPIYSAKAIITLRAQNVPPGKFVDEEVMSADFEKGTQAVLTAGLFEFDGQQYFLGTDKSSAVQVNFIGISPSEYSNRLKAVASGGG